MHRPTNVDQPEEFLFQLTKIELLERLSNGRKQELGLIRRVQQMSQKQVFDLLQLTLNFFTGPKLSILIRRLFSLSNIHSWNRTEWKKRTTYATGYRADSLTKVSIKLPFTKGLDITTMFMKHTKGIASTDPSVYQCRAILVRVAPIYPPTMKEYLNNETRATEALPCVCARHCACSEIHAFFAQFDCSAGTGLPTGLCRDDGGHLVLRLLETDFITRFLRLKCSSHTRILPPVSWFHAHSQQAADKLNKTGGSLMSKATSVAIAHCTQAIAKMIGAIRDQTSEERSLVCHELLQPLLELINHNCICCELDKAKYDLCIRCVYGHKIAYMKMKDQLYNPFPIQMLDEVYSNIWRLLRKGELFEDPKYPFWKDWGLLKIRPKDSAFSALGAKPKARPLVSYFDNPLRDLFRAACRFGNLLVHLTGESCGVFDVDKIHANFDQFNEETRKNSDPLDQYQIQFYKFDIDNFYGNVKQSDVIKAFSWMVSVADSKMERRRIKTVAMIPTMPPTRKMRPEFNTERHWSHPFRLRPRRAPINPAVEFRNVIIKTNRGQKFLTRDFLRELMLFDMNNRIIRVGRQFYVQKDGWPQGSPMGPWVATMVAAYYDFKIESILHRCLPHPNGVLLQRWIDDIFVTLRLPADCDTPTVQHKVRYILDKILRDFGLKQEGHKVFVGLKVCTTPAEGFHKVCTQLFNRNERTITEPRTHTRQGYDHRYSRILPVVMSPMNNVPRGVLLGVIMGQLITCLDKSSTPEAAVMAMVIKFHEYLLMGHPYHTLRKVLTTLQSKYRHLPLRQVLQVGMHTDLANFMNHVYDLQKNTRGV